METKKNIENNNVSELKGDGPAARVACIALMVSRSVFSFELQYILTLLTMAIGSLALAATLFVGEGALKGLWTDLDRLMGNRVIVYPDAGPDQRLLKIRPTAEITLEDLKYIQSRIPDARYIAPRFFGNARVTSNNKERYLSVDGIDAAMEAEEAFTPVQGRVFSRAAHNGLKFECFLTRSAMEHFGIKFAGHPVVGVDGFRYTVVGVIPDPPEADPRFQQRIVLPYLLTQLHWGRPGVASTLVISWKGPETMEPTIQMLRKAMNECRAPDAYYLSSSQFKIKKRKGIVSNFMTFGTAQSLFCILVAAIGVVNVMLANVVKRMREFAIRIAMGAKQKDIMILVLAESFMIGLIGAAAGILMAIVISAPLCDFISSKIPEASKLAPLIEFKGIIIPLIVCSLSSLFAGIIPALRAGRMDILSTLRAE